MASKPVQSIGDLVHDRRNPRKHNERNLRVIVDSLHQVGFARSIVIDENNEILAGNGVTEAAVLAGIENVIEVEADGNTIIAVRRRGLSEEQKQKLKYYDNRSGELADWDADVVLADIGAGLDLSAMFRQDELDEMLADLQPKTEGDTPAQTDRAEELRQQWGTAPGQLWLLDSGKGHPHRLICGDCTDAATVARVMGGEKAQITFTSPPYNLGENVKLSTRNKTQNAYRDGYQDNKTSGDYLELLSSFLDIAMSVSEYQFVNMQLLAGNKVALWEFTYSRRLHLADVAIWAKSNPQPAAAKKVMNSAFEFIFIFASEQEPSRAIATANFHGTFSNVYAGTVNSENVAPDLHSAAFPLSLCSDFLSAFTVKGNTVFEPFLGTGTTLIGCENLARRCCAVEIDPKFAAVCLQRFLDHTGATPVLLGDS